MNMKKTITTILCITAAIVLFSCDIVKRKDDSDNVLSDNKEDTFVYRIKDTITVFRDDSLVSKRIIAPNEAESRKKFHVDEKLTSLSNFIAAMNTDDGQFDDLQEKPVYQIHKGIINKKTWTKIENSDLKPIVRWRNKNNISLPGDTMALLYPFSGPDFLYAYSFFPYCHNYIMVGLESVGTIPDINRFSDKELSKYLESLRVSLNYYTKVGYFTTNQMRRDFSEGNFDGAIHLLLFYLARTHHKIIDVMPVYIDSYGKAKPVTKETKNAGIQGIKIDFTGKDQAQKKSLYYFELNLSNENLSEHDQFIPFLTRFDEKITYLKSASYILHNAKFSQMRDLILDQSVKILQDDSGIPYRFFKNNPDFDVELYGNYTKTIKDFKYHYQTDLKQALDNQEGDKSLGFTLGYNAWHGETVLLYAERDGEPDKQIAEATDKTNKKEADKTKEKTTKKTNTDTKKTEGVVYKVQILMSSEKLSPAAPDFKGLKNIDYYRSDNVYKYTIGKEKNMDDCMKIQSLARGKGFNDAFIVAFHNGKRISIQKALELQK